MATPTAERLVTAAEFEQMPEPRDGGKVELVRGRVVVMAPVGPEHGERANRLGGLLDAFASRHRLGRVRVETGYWMGTDPDHILAPDVSFVPESRVAQETIRHGAVEQPPDLAVEVTSPGDTDAQVQEKVDDYLAAGVQRVWVVRPGLRTVTVHRPSGDAHTFREGARLTSEDASFSVAGFELELPRLFETYPDA